MASFVLVGVGTGLLVRELGCGMPAAGLAGVLVAFNTFRFGSISHIHALSTQWIPFALWAVHRCLRRGRGAIAVAVTVLLVSLSSVYYAYFFFLAVAVFLVAHWSLGCPAAPGGRPRALAGVGVAAVGTALMLVPYLIARDCYALAQDPGQAFWFSARGVTYLGAILDPLGYVRQRYVLHENSPTVVGLATLPLLSIGLVVGAPMAGGRRLAGVYFATALVLALISLGPVMQWYPGFTPGVPGPWVALAAIVPGFASLRVPVRACTLVVQSLCVLAAFGADALWRRARARAHRVVVLAAFVIVAVLESWRPAFHIVTAMPGAGGTPAVYAWLARQPGHDAVIELPIGLAANDATYMVRSATHWKPLVNGYSGFTPTAAFFRALMSSFPSPVTVRLLHAIGVRWVVVHLDDLPSAHTLCAGDLGAIAPYVTLEYRDDNACVIGILGAPPEPESPQDRSVALDGVTVTSSDGRPAVAAIDGRLATHWVQGVDPDTEGWLQVDLPEPHTVSRVVLRLGSHFGEYMRQWRVDASDDGAAWRPAGHEGNAVPPLIQMRTDPFRLATELRLDAPIPTRHLRIVRMGRNPQAPVDLWANWKIWGVHELEVYEIAP